MKTDGRRISRVEKELQQVIAQFLISKFKTPLPGLVTVSYIVMSADLKNAKVFVSLLVDNSRGTDGKKDLDKTIEILQSKAYEVQKHIAENLKIRFTPKLTFYPDTGTANALKVENILKELAEKK